MRAQSIKKQNILSAGLQVTFDSSFEFDDHLKEYLVRSNAIQDRVLHQVVNCSIKNWQNPLNSGRALIDH